jgi:acyl phosphate:glycerol-3-phosphate acyltransferase
MNAAALQRNLNKNLLNMSPRQGKSNDALIYQITPLRKQSSIPALLHSKPESTMSLYLIVSSVAYLLGSIPFGFLLVLLVRKEDIREQGSGNIGATNVLRSGAKGLGALTFLLDGSKGCAAVAVAEFLARGRGPTLLQNLAIMAALFVVLGHMFPVWLRFKGGKGVATAFGAFLAFCPLAALAALGLWIVIVALTGYVSLASILAAVVLPFLTLWLSRGRYGYASGTAVFASCWIVVAKHWPNILRLMHGTEHGFGASRKTGA